MKIKDIKTIVLLIIIGLLIGLWGVFLKQNQILTEEKIQEHIEQLKFERTENGKN